MEAQIVEALDRGKIVLVTGLRGVGKTTMLRSLERRLERTKGKGSTVFQDLEDPRFSPRPRRETLELFAGDSRYILLDEVGRVDGWLKWARSQKAGVVACISGPRIETDAGDVAQFTLYPERITDTSVDLDRYLSEGGLPGVSGREDSRDRLVDLFNKCLYKDVVQRFEVRDIDKLTAISVYLLASTSRQVSATRLKGLLSRSVDQARGFLAHLERSGLIHLVPRIEDGQRARAQAARRCFAADCGLSVALSSKELDTRDLAETAVFHELLRQGHRVLAWRARGRLGLAVAGESSLRLMIEVAYQDRHQPGTKALASAMAAHSCQLGLLLTDDGGQDTVAVTAGTIVRQSFKGWLESPELPGVSAAAQAPTAKNRPKKKKKPPEPRESTGLPRYLL